MGEKRTTSWSRQRSSVELTEVFNAKLGAIINDTATINTESNPLNPLVADLESKELDLDMKKEVTIFDN